MSAFKSATVLLIFYTYSSLAIGGANQIEFYRDPGCVYDAPFAVLTFPQTAESCHDFAVKNNLADPEAVGSYAVNINGTSFCHDRVDDFEKTCTEAFASASRSYSPSLSAPERPAKAIEVAQRQLAVYLGKDVATILKEFAVDWEYIYAGCDDDQPLWIKFTNQTQNCRVELGSVSLIVFRTACFSK